MKSVALHAFALLNYLGYKSLSEYQKEQWEAEEADRAFWQDYCTLAYMSM